MSSSIFLHFIYLGRVFILTPGLSDSASLANQLALGSLVFASTVAGITDARPTQI